MGGTHVKTMLEEATRKAAECARNSARDFSGVFANEDLSQQVLQHFRAFVLGKIENDDRIDRAAATVQDKAHAVMDGLDLSNRKASEPAREDLIRAIDNLERSILQFGIGNSMADALGFAVAGQRIADD